MEKVQLNISGMHCASCAQLSELALGKIDGVSRADVNYDSKIAEVTYDQEKASIDDIVDAIAETGYKASVINEN